MKKLLTLTLIMLCALCSIKAQLKMSSTNGNICVAATPVPVSNVKLQVLSTTAVQNLWSYAFTSSNTNMWTTSSYCVGAEGYSAFPSALNMGVAFGVYGVAGNTTSGYNYGVFGVLGGTNNGAGVYGAARGNLWMDVAGNWAGFFNGNAKVLGTCFANAFTLNSDHRLKKNITPITNTLNLISGLNAVSYQYKTRQELKTDGVIPADTSTAPEALNIYSNKIHYGYIAQDVQQILPNLVYVGEDSLLGVDYIGLIPLIIEAIKQQNDSIKQQSTTISNLQQQLNKCCNLTTPFSTNGNKMMNNDSSTTGSSAILYQNVPNPFSQNTIIKCYIPDGTINANIYIYDMQGTQIKKIQINGKGNENITIQGSELRAGMYMYTLIIDGKEIDTKKMILTN